MVFGSKQRSLGAAAVLTIAAVSGLLMTQNADAKNAKLKVVGYIERAAIFPGDLRLNAKLDTGARTSSLHAKNIEELTRNGEKWVRFTLPIKGRDRVFLRKIFRVSRIRRARVGVVSRPVVKLGICIGGYYKLAEVNLTDRTGMIYQLLIGRRFMRTGNLVVDSGRRKLSKPNCPNAPADEQ